MPGSIRATGDRDIFIVFFSADNLYIIIAEPIIGIRVRKDLVKRALDT